MNNTFMTREIHEELNKLREFKRYVHAKLDEMGVPTDPEAEKNKETGCRIEGRLNYLEKQISDLKNDLLDFCLVIDESPLAKTDWFQKMNKVYRKL
jgi:seryl-tRNA synthetase